MILACAGWLLVGFSIGQEEGNRIFCPNLTFPSPAAAQRIEQRDNHTYAWSQSGPCPRPRPLRGPLNSWFPFYFVLKTFLSYLFLLFLLLLVILE